MNNAVTIVDFQIVEKTSKKGNVYKALIAIDENGKQYLIRFING